MGFRTVALFFVSICGWIGLSGATHGANPMMFPGYTVTVAPEGQDTVPLNKHVNLLVTLVPTAGTSPGVSDFKFDARMPQHKHGMVTTAKVSRVKDLQYRVEGVRLHMPGLWLLEFTIVHKTGETRISSPLELAP